MPASLGDSGTQERLSDRLNLVTMDNLFTPLPEAVDHEEIEELLRRDNIRVERILSRGQTSPETGWYDQEESEWVVVLQGAGEITFEDGERVRLEPGGHVNIPAHRRHRVSWTDIE